MKGKNKISMRLLKKTWICYLFLLPMAIYLILLNYIPMYGIQIAFRDYRVSDGFFGSEWVGLKWFTTFIHSIQFETLIKNTIVISLYALLVGFPMPIIFALLLNYITHIRLKKTVQMITYAPHFISMVVYCGMILVLLSSDGMVNQLLMKVGLEPVKFLGKGEYFRHIYVWTNVLKNIGWGSVLYISVLSGVSPELHEAAIVDGATRFQRMCHIDIPSITPTMVIMLIMRLGDIMSVGFEKAFLLQNSINLEYSEIISTYVYKLGMQGGHFSYSTAIGFFNSVINLILLVVVNRVSRKISDISLW